MPDESDDKITRRDGDFEATTVRESPRRAHAPTMLALDAARYRVVDKLGRGGMGEVQLARDGVFGREVAIKRMLAKQPSAHAVERFMREARIQGGLDHPAIPPVHELAIDSDGKPYFVMKRVAGITLGTVLQRTVENDAAIIARYPRNKLLRAFADACLAVELAHTRGVIHRDLKPSNVMLGDLGEVYVLDWGVAKVIGDSDPALSEIGGSGDVTHAGAVVGTPGYMPPEQAVGVVDIDHRADVFALGCMLFEILTIKKAHAAASRSPRACTPDRDIPPELDELCVAATHPDRAKRLASAREVGEGVQRYLDGDRDLEQRRRLAREHLDRAQVATDPDLAMREAGRALALDPSLPGAAELVGRLMIEPPKTLSPELARSLEQARDEGQSRHSRIGLRYAMTMYLPLVAAFIFLEVTPTFTLVTVGFLIAMLAVGAYSVHHPRSTALTIAAIALNTAILVVIARVFTPFLIAPSTAVLGVLVMISGPALRRRGVVIPLVIAFSLGLLGPWIAELAGWIEATTLVTSDRITLFPRELGAGALQVETALTLYAPLLVAVSTIWAVGFARSEDAARRQLHIQAWRLRQLVT